MNNDQPSQFAGEPPSFVQVSEAIVMAAIKHPAGPTPVNAVRVRVVRFAVGDIPKYCAEFSTDSLNWHPLDIARNIEDDAVAIATRFLASTQQLTTPGTVVWRSE